MQKAGSDRLPGPTAGELHRLTVTCLGLSYPSAPTRAPGVVRHYIRHYAAAQKSPETRYSLRQLSEARCRPTESERLKTGSGPCAFNWPSWILMQVCFLHHTFEKHGSGRRAGFQRDTNKKRTVQVLEKKLRNGQS